MSEHSSSPTPLGTCPTIKIDCAEFQHSHEIVKLIGSLPGYLGHRETHLLPGQELLHQYHVAESAARGSRIGVGRTESKSAHRQQRRATFAARHQRQLWRSWRPHFHRAPRNGGAARSRMQQTPINMSPVRSRPVAPACMLSSPMDVACRALQVACPACLCR